MDQRVGRWYLVTSWHYQLQMLQRTDVHWCFTFCREANRHLGLPKWRSGHESACQCRRLRRCGLIPGSGTSHGGGHGNSLQYSCLENPMDRGAWRTTVHAVTKSWPWLSNWACRQMDSAVMLASLVATVLRTHEHWAGLDLESRSNVIENSSSKMFSFSQQNGRMLPLSTCPGWLCVPGRQIQFAA